MKHLHLRINKDLESDGGTPPVVFGTISGFDASSGRKRRDVTPRREAIPISGNPADARPVELAPGQYLVEVTMPSGEIISNQIDMTPDEDASLVLQAEESPHEWLSWQHLMGNVATSPPIRELSYVGRAKSAKTTARRGVRAKAAAASPSTDLPTRLYWLPTPIPILAGAAGNDTWTVLNELAAADSIVPEVLNVGPLREIPSYDSDAQRAVYRVVHGAGTTGAALALQSTLQRDFIVVPQQGTIELLSLPMPWPVIPSGREAVVEIVLQLTAHVSDFAASMTVRDDRLGVFLGYLSSGSLAAVREIAEDAKEMLYEKRLNPLAAVAGAYAMVATATNDSRENWHQWVENLANWSPHIPDGAIQLAQLHLRLRRSKDDLDAARHWLLEGYRRGLPYFTMGVRWLLDGLEKVARQDSTMEDMLKAVRSLAWLLHPQSPFTIMHLGPR